jgi:hypothetical protein
MPRARFVLLVALVFAARPAWPQGNPLGPEFRVNTHTTLSQGGSSVTVDSLGNFVVVWVSQDQDGWGSGIFGQRYSSSGTALGPEFRVNTYITNNQDRPSVVADSSGNFVVVWRSQGQDGSAEGVFGQRYAGSGSPLGPEFRVNTYTTSYQNDPSVAADSAGNFVVVWTSNLQDGSGAGIFGQRYASSGSPLGPEFRVNTYTTSPQLLPSVASDSAGNFVVAWTQWDGGIDVFGQRYDSTGAPLGSEFRVNSYTPGYQSSPDIAADSSGNFVVVWHRFYFVGDIFGQRYAGSGAPLGPEFQVTTSPGYQYNPSVASDASGNFVVVWQGSTPDGDNVFGQRYASSGAPLGGEFRVNTYTTANQSTADVTSDPLGHFVVVWNSQDQDGGGDGVFGQRYTPILPVELMQFKVD